MKNLIMTMICLLFTFSCFDTPHNHEGEWYIRNSRSEAIYLKTNGVLGTVKIEPNETYVLYFYEVPYDEGMPEFSEMANYLKTGVERGNLTVTITTEKGEELESWSHQENNTNNSFFTEQSWTKKIEYSSLSDAEKYYYTWIYDI